MCRFRPSEKVEPPLPHATSAIGIDVGIARFATFSDGRFLEPLNSFNRHEAKLSRAQRMSRKHWLADAHSQVLQQALKDLERAYANFFAKRSAPRVSRRRGSTTVFVSRKASPTAASFLPKQGLGAAAYPPHCATR
jgi:transposase